MLEPVLVGLKPALLLGYVVLLVLNAAEPSLKLCLPLVGLTPQGLEVADDRGYLHGLLAHVFLS